MNGFDRRSDPFARGQGSHPTEGGWQYVARRKVMPIGVIA